MALIPCPSCDRHIYDDVRCPFCQAGTEADAPAAATTPPDDDGSRVRPLYGVDRR